MWNPFSKTPQLDEDGKPKMSFLQRMAMKKLEKMSPEERDKIMEDAFKPENRKKLLKEMDKMVKSGMMSKSQVKKAKERMGIYE